MFIQGLLPEGMRLRHIGILAYITTGDSCKYVVSYVSTFQWSAMVPVLMLSLMRVIQAQCTIDFYLGMPSRVY